jgi:hypothetical protein
MSFEDVLTRLTDWFAPKVSNISARSVFTDVHSCRVRVVCNLLLRYVHLWLDVVMMIMFRPSYCVIVL